MRETATKYTATVAKMKRIRILLTFSSSWSIITYLLFGFCDEVNLYSLL